MCAMHWKMVPAALQREVWRTFVPGQEERKNPTREYLAAADAAIEAVAQKETGKSGQRPGRVWRQGILIPPPPKGTCPPMSEPVKKGDRLRILVPDHVGLQPDGLYEEIGVVTDVTAESIVTKGVNFQIHILSPFDQWYRKVRGWIHEARYWNEAKDWLDRLERERNDTREG